MKNNTAGSRLVNNARRDCITALLGALAASCTRMSKTDDRLQPANARDSTAPASTAAAPTSTPTPAASPAPTPLPPVVSFAEAVAGTARAVFTAGLPVDAKANSVVIDPLIDGITGYQSTATQSIQDRILGIARKDFPQYAVQSITPQSLKQQPRFLIGTFTPVNAQNKPTGTREAFWFCLVMGDLRSGKIIAKAVARARLDDADTTPTGVFGDSPVWSDDATVRAYVAACQGSKVGDAIKPEYLDGLLAAALLSEANDAYNEGRYAEALDLYSTARKTPAGDQLRVYNGIYLSLARLGRSDQATAAFRDLVDFGIRKQRLAVKFLFRPGSVRFASDSSFSANYGMWLHQIAARAAATGTCLQITGHTSPTGSAALNDNLSLVRAQYIQSRLEGEDGQLKKRTIAVGVGSRENLIGTGRDDASDALDRRVELKPVERCEAT